MSCNVCHLFEAQGLPCEFCATKRPKARRKGASPAKRRMRVPKPFSEQEIAAMDNATLAVILLDGRLAASIGYEAAYQAIVDKLVAAGYGVEMYRNRIVSGLGE